ncbi:MAG: PIG-L family deacetylase [Pirellulaceae bacterium]|nr:PIG-L family deacetylase [Pirellulaceae bacterium]
MWQLGLERIESVLCLGAHPDDIDIGCGGTLLRIGQRNPRLCVEWIVFSGEGVRAEEARHSPAELLGPRAEVRVVVETFRDRCFPACWEQLKARFDLLGRAASPQLILTHRLEDAHQDHRLIAELTWQTFRDHWILEYEVPKYEGDLGQPNVFVPLSADEARHKAERTYAAFPSQHAKRWFTPETMLALARLRGIEAAAESGYAEGFTCRKLVL